MQNYPFTYGCMSGEELPQIIDFRTNSWMMVTWNCMEMALCWKGVTIRALAVSYGHAYTPHDFAAVLFC